MSLWQLLHFSAFAIYIYLIGVVLYKSPKRNINRVCSIFLLSLAFWSFGVALFHNIEATRETAVLAMRIASFGFCSFRSLLLWFCLVFTKQKKVLEKKIYKIRDKLEDIEKYKVDEKFEERYNRVKLSFDNLLINYNKLKAEEL